MLRNRILLFIIIALLSGIGILQYYNFKIGKNTQATAGENKDNGSGKVKGEQSNTIDLILPEIKNIESTKIPTRKKNISDPKIYAKNYILIDERIKYPLIEKDSHMRVAIASTTKIMTAIIALENYQLDQIVEISQNAATQIGSDVYLRKGEKLTVKSLLYALLIKSGNDAAMALAENMKDGGLQQFVSKMNEKAKYLSLQDTEFKDPAGLDDTGYSSAFDLALISAYALRNKIFQEIIMTQDYTIVSEDSKFEHKLETSNRLIKIDEPLYYQNAIGIKTGYTPDAGHCLVSAAKSGDTTLIGVVLNTIESTNDASAKESKKLLEWGFLAYEF